MFRFNYPYWLIAVLFLSLSLFLSLCLSSMPPNGGINARRSPLDQPPPSVRNACSRHRIDQVEPTRADLSHSPSPNQSESG